MRLMRDPLVLFFVIGGLLVLAYGLADGFLAGDARRRIEVDEAVVAMLAGNFERTWRRSPTAEELSALVDAHVREEVLYREALALGLDDDDVIVRRRMVQKMELLTQDLALLSDPTDEQLRGFFAENRERYRIPDRISFTQVFFSGDRRGSAAEADAQALLAGIVSGDIDAEGAGELGDPSLLAPEYRQVSAADVERSFGGDFAAAVFDLTEGWHGPLRSPFGVHLVHVTGRTTGGPPAFEQVRAELLRDFNRERSEAATEELYRSLLEAYEVAVDEQALADATLEASRAGSR